MKVLGISPLDKDSTVSFVENGRVVFACGEERLSRVKLQDGFPHRALALGMETTGWGINEIDQVAYAFLDAAGERDAIAESRAADAKTQSMDALKSSSKRLREALGKSRRSFDVSIPGLDPSREFMPPKAYWKQGIYRAGALSAGIDSRLHRRFLGDWMKAAVADHKLRNHQLQEGLAEFGLLHRLTRYNHHHTHAANCFYSSGYERALVVSLDGYGTGNAGGIYSAGPEGIQLLQRIAFPHSLGLYYEFVTSALGFRAGRHEGKIVGLAAYGDPEILGPVLRARFSGMDRGHLKMHGGMNYLFTRFLAQHFAKRDVAAAYQTVLEEVAAALVGYWAKYTGHVNIAVSGGVHANVKLNQRLREIPGVESAFVYPNMGDGGCATGAALLAFPTKVLRRAVIDDVYYGPEYDDAEIEAALEAEDLEFERHERIEDEIGGLLAKDRIIARFHGRMEYGPRALGNRSILYPAKDPAVNLWLNTQLGRTEFMPFAPACLAEDASELFHNFAGCEKTAEFMTITFDCTDRMRRLCPAAVHIDGTARPQLVTRDSNPSFYRIIAAYREASGIPAIINTSFNMHEEPIVCSPQDAIRAFLQGRMDYLAIGPYLVPHPQSIQIDAERRELAHV